MTNYNIEEISAKIFAAISAKDLVETKRYIDILYNMLMADLEAVKWVANPVNLTRLHDELEGLGVPRKLLMLRHRVPNQHRRAIMFVKAMSNGLGRVIG